MGAAERRNKDVAAARRMKEAGVTRETITCPVCSRTVARVGDGNALVAHVSKCGGNYRG